MFRNREEAKENDLIKDAKRAMYRTNILEDLKDVGGTSGLNSKDSSYHQMSLSRNQRDRQHRHPPGYRDPG